MRNGKASHARSNAPKREVWAGKDIQSLQRVKSVLQGVLEGKIVESGLYTGKAAGYFIVEGPDGRFKVTVEFA